jgi:hypothetical protein
MSERVFERATSVQARDTTLTLAGVAGPAAWFVNLVTAYIITPPAHERGAGVALRVVGAVALLVAIAGAVVAARHLRDPGERVKFHAAYATTVCAFSALLILGMGLVPFLLPAGAEP